MRVGIVGGGLGGLLTAYMLERRSPRPCDITIFEASARLGGKIITRQFESAPVRYEAGAAELYDYSQLGPDPLRELISELGLSVTNIDGRAVIIGDRILRSQTDIAREFGPSALNALNKFNSMARAAISPAEYYESDWKADNKDSLSRASFRDLLAKVGDDNVRRYVEVAVHSDLATEPHLTNAMYGLQNYLMNEADYMRLYVIDGGIERLPRALAERIGAQVRLNHPVTKIERGADRTYRISSRSHGEARSDNFDYVVVALPNNWLPLVNFGGATLGDAMHRHHKFYDYPAHYLRVSVLFERPFWRTQLRESYFMLDAFGGCCVYDESSRIADSPYGVLGWLLAGDAALAMSNLADAVLIDAVLDSLPTSLRDDARQYLREGRVHRFAGAVNGLPGGYPAREPDSRHLPEPENHRELFVVGDYLFDSTINGVLDSADVVAEFIADDLRNQARLSVASTPAAATQVQATEPLPEMPVAAAARAEAS
ncbi:MAG TPA: FAD-dependent oxidoreductase [Candidatus Binataceae bacterium]|nr:FAD-dependent oxidoreductase [Candidatus Binataceae bacterium]